MGKGDWYVHGSPQITLAWHVDLGAKETQPNHKAKQPFLVMILGECMRGDIFQQMESCLELKIS